MERKALVDIKLNTVELFEGEQELKEIRYRFKDYMDEFESKIIVPEEKILDVFKDKDKIVIVNYYNVNTKESYGELSYEEWKEIENKKKNKRVIRDLEKYEDLKVELGKSVDELFAEEEISDVIENHYITLGVGNKSYKLLLNADLCEEFESLLDNMIETEKELDGLVNDNDFRKELKDLDLI